MSGVPTYQNTDRTVFTDEFKEDFERTKTKLTILTNNDGVRNGSTIQWDVSGIGGRASSRGRDGNIVRGQHPFSAVTATLVEEFSEKFTINDFDAFVANSGVRAQLSKKTIAQCNRAIDQKIIDTLDGSSTTVYNSGTAIALTSLKGFLKLRDTLLANDVPGDDGQIWMLLSIQAGSALTQIPEWKSSDYVSVRPMENGLEAVGYRRWNEVNIMTFNGVTGAAGATAKCYIFHKSALGHCLGGDPEPHVYWYEPEHRWEHYALIRHAAKECLPRGVLPFRHDDTAAYT